MSAGNSQGSVKEYTVRLPKASKKHYHMMRFNADLGTDYFKTWTNCKMERENNLKEYKTDHDTPKFGAGSEFGREQREEARRKRYGINVKKYKMEDQPWLLNVGGKNGKKFKGIREGGVAANVSWYVFMQGKDGAFEAYPVDEWYNFQPINRYKALSAEQAEEEFVRRDKIMNYFQVMYEKKFCKEGADPDSEEGTKKKSSKKSLKLSEMDDWESDDDDDDDDEKGDDDDGPKKKKKKKGKGAARPKTGGKAKKEGDESDRSCEEESDDYNEGNEHDYISSDSSDSDQKDDEVVVKALAGVEEGDALKKLLNSDDEDEEEENKEKEKEKLKEEEANKKEEGDDKDKDRKKKKKKKDKNADSEESSTSSGDESKKKDSKSSHRREAVNELKRKMKVGPGDDNDMPQVKRHKGAPHLDAASSSGASVLPSDSIEDDIRRYLARKPMTTTELLKNIKKKKDMDSEQHLTSIAQCLKRLKPEKRIVKGKLYLSLKPS